MAYLITVFITAVVFLAPVVALNWMIDPAGLFKKTTFGHQYAKSLLNSKHGLLFPNSVDERVIKASLIEIASGYDCVVVGSSHIMQVGSVRKHRSFHGCLRIVNLGVSGAGIEDHVVLSWLAVTEAKPKILILGIDPWTLAFGKDERWKVRYADRHDIASEEIARKKPSLDITLNRWMNLINIQYTERSLHHLLIGPQYREADLLRLFVTPQEWRGALHKLNSSKAAPPIAEEIREAKGVDEDFGGESAITLPDGSHIYSAEYISKKKSINIPIGGVIYKTDGSINEISAIELYRRLIFWIKNHGVKPVLLMTPYHQNVWMLETSPNVTAMVSTEEIVKKMGRELGVPVIGSFRPDIVGCSPDEFYDFMHPMASCLAKFTAKAEF